MAIAANDPGGTFSRIHFIPALQSGLNLSSFFGNNKNIIAQIAAVSVEDLLYSSILNVRF
jgi:hypothetical protein